MSSVKDYSEECGRCLHCARPGCRAACPIGNDIPQFLQAVRAAEWERAADIIGHPFGEVCGYICPHEKQCQGGCVLARRDSAVRMGWVESAFFAAHPYAVRRRSDLAAGYRVAVVGGGVSGLTFAASMYSQGADVTVFERNKLLSTLSMIPSFRLPTEALDRILRQITDKFTIVRQNVDSELLCRLHEQFDMVYLATGTTELYR